MNAYKRWVLKHSSTLQCSPALMVAATLVGLGIIAYVNRAVILTTFLITMASTLAFAVIAMIVYVAYKVTKSERRSLRELPLIQDTVLPLPQAAPQSWPSLSSWKPGNVLADDRPAETTRAMEIDAEVLADDSMELLWTPDGKSLVGKKH